MKPEVRAFEERSLRKKQRCATLGKILGRSSEFTVGTKAVLAWI